MEATREFDGYYADYFGRVVGAAYLATGSREDAHDIAQEAFVRTWMHWDRVGRWPDPSRFTFRVASNLTRSLGRRARVARRVLRPDAEAGQDPTESWATTLAVRTVLLSLTPRQRWAVILTDLLGFNSVEAAAIVGVKPSTLRVHVVRARSAIRAIRDGAPAAQPAQGLVKGGRPHGD